MVITCFDQTVSLKPYPFESHESKLANGDPVFLTYSGPAWQGCQLHARAFQSLGGLFRWNITRPQDFLRHSQVGIDPSAFRHIHEIDRDGNSILSRILMSHIMIDENDGYRAYQTLNKRNLVSLRTNMRGQTPLMLAVEAGWPKLVEEVLKLHPKIDEKDIQGHDAIDYLAYCQLRPDNNIAASRIIYSVEGIAEQILLHVPVAKRPMMQAKALKILTEIRKEDFGIGIRP